MKKILVPTDFSENASFAIDYAVEMAIAAKAQLILFHVYNFPVMAAEIPIELPIDEKEKYSMEKLKKIRDNIHLKTGSELVIEYKCRFGFPVEEINLFAVENDIDLIVMGMEGADYLTEKLIGNITTSLLKES